MSTQARGIPLVQHLKTRAQFQAVLAGSVLVRAAHFALLQRPVTVAAAPTDAATAAACQPAPLFFSEQLYVGAMVPKRWAKRAVTRNLVKRQIYSVALQFAGVLPPAAYLIRLRQGFDSQMYVSASSPQLKAAIRAELLQLFAAALMRCPLPAGQARP